MKVVEVMLRGTILAQPVVSVSLGRKIQYIKVMQSLKKVGVTVAQRQRVREMVLHGGWNAEEYKCKLSDKFRKRSRLLQHLQELAKKQL